MPQAVITVNAVTGSDDDVPINTLVQLSNDNSGGETTYLWTIVDQPEGAADALSSTTILNPTLTPRKEGTYLLELVVNQGLATEATDRVIVAVRHLKTHDRIPAAGEADENGASGWAKANGVNALLARLIDMQADPGLVVGLINEATMDVGRVVVPEGTALIKSGLPGEERVAQWGYILGTNPILPHSPLGIVVGAADGGAISTGKMGIFRVHGLAENVPVTGGGVSFPVYVSDTGTLTSDPGSYQRPIGVVVRVISGTHCDVWINGLPPSTPKPRYEYIETTTAGPFIIDATMHGKTVRLNNAGPIITVSVPILEKGMKMEFIQMGAGQLNFDADGTVIYCPATFVLNTNEQYSKVSLEYLEDDEVLVVGDLELA